MSNEYYEPGVQFITHHSLRRTLVLLNLMQQTRSLNALHNKIAYTFTPQITLYYLRF